jgi:hypothetical protein
MIPSPMYGQAHGLGMASNALNDAFYPTSYYIFCPENEGGTNKK